MLSTAIALLVLPPSAGTQVVDMVMFKTFGELTDADVIADPLILLPCGHLFSTSTLDGHMAIAEAYEISSSTAAGSGCGSSGIAAASSSSSKGDPASTNTPSSSTAAGTNSSNSSNTESPSCPSDLEPYSAPKHRSDFPQPKQCPDCRGFIAGVQRYGRIVLHSQLGVTQRKYAEAVR